MIKQPITIHQLIVHKIYHKTMKQAGLYDLESPVDNDLADILRKQITDNCEYRYTNNAVFEKSSDGEEGFPEICEKLLHSTANFVPQSQKIAERLFAASNQNTSESDLVICTFSEDGSSSLRWLALLKMEPQSAIIQEEKIRSGKKMAILTLVKEVLPTGYLQKCAFIKPFDSTPSKGKKGPDLYVLDLQRGKYGAERTEVASFFSKRFLQCRLERSSEDLTASFFRGSHDWLSKKKNQWPEVNIMHFEEEIETTVRDDQINLLEFAQRVISDPDEQDEYVTYMREKRGITNTVFKPDPAKRAELLRYTWYEGDNDLLVRIATDALTEEVLSVHKRPGQPYKITITTSTWSRKYGKG